MPNIPQIYDASEDRLRPVTQADIDQLVQIAILWAQFRKKANDLHSDIVAQNKLRIIAQAAARDANP
jgi:hypothetical protein